jgi:hypothetical protein
VAPNPIEEHTMRCHLAGAMSLCLLLLHSQPAALAQSRFDLTRSTGEVVLGHWPDCAFLVIETKDSFSLTTWVSGLWSWDEGDRVYGPADQMGRQTVLVVGEVMSGDMTLDIEETTTDSRRAQKAYYKRCHGWEGY